MASTTKFKLYNNGDLSTAGTVDDTKASIKFKNTGVLECAGISDGVTLGGTVKHRLNNDATIEIAGTLYEGWLDRSLDDEFTTARAAGAVHNTACEPGPGTRSVVDTTGKITINSSGKLYFSGGRSLWSDPYLYYDPITRAAGLICKATFSSLKSSGDLFIFDICTSGNRDQQPIRGGSDASVAISGLELKIMDGSFYNPPYYAVVSNITINTNYAICMVLRATGVFYFVKGGTQFPNWTLIWIRYSASNATLYLVIKLFDVGTSFTADNVFFPNILWLPSPLASDSFTRADAALGSTDGIGHPEGVTGGIGSGGSGLAWTGATWTISGNYAVNTPTLGAEFLTNGDMETGSPPTSWNTYGGTPTRVTDERTGGSGTYSLNIARNGDNYPFALRSISSTVGCWYYMGGWVKNIDATSGFFQFDTNAGGVFYSQGKEITSTSWTYTAISGRALDSTSFRAETTIKVVGLADGVSARFDDISVKQITTSTLFAKLPAASAPDVIVDVKVHALTTGTQAGILLNYADDSNFLIANLSGTQFILTKCVAGTYTVLSTVTTDFVADTVLRIAVNKESNNSLTYRCYYGTTKLGSDVNVTNVGLISNTIFGMFSTYEGNTLKDFTLFAKGSGGEYSALERV